MTVNANCRRSARTASTSRPRRLGPEQLSRLDAVLILDRENRFDLLGDEVRLAVRHTLEGRKTPIEQHRKVAIARIDSLHRDDGLCDVERRIALLVAIVIVEHEVDVLEAILDLEYRHAHRAE